MIQLMHNVDRRIWASVTIVIALAPFILPSAQAQEGAAPDSRQTNGKSAIALAYRAIGGERAIQRVRTFVLEGALRAGFNGLTAEPSDRPAGVSIQAILPEHYLRVERHEHMLSRQGFSAGVPISDYEPLTPDARLFASPPGPKFIDLQRMRLTYLLIGMFADARGVVPLKADRSRTDAHGLSVEFVGPEGQAFWLDINQMNGVPERVRYFDTVQYPERPLNEADRAAGKVPPQKTERAEVTITFEDRRPVQGLQLPHGIRRTAAGRRFEEIRVDRFVINPALKSSDFLTPIKR